MAEPIEYQSNQKSACRGNAKKLDNDSTNGLSWEWNSYEEFAIIDSWTKNGTFVYLSWKFEWDEEEMKKEGIHGFEGVMTVQNIKDDGSTIPFRFDIHLTRSGECIRKRMGTFEEVKYPSIKNAYFQFGFALNKITDRCASAYFPDRLIHPSFFDGVLVVEGQKINVNKNYLSFRSDYFNTLFNSDFKEKSISEIPIEDVKYEDFVCFMNVIHPTDPKSPTDENAEILLKLADRFMMPAVTRLVEQHLLTNNTDLPFGKILELADKYKLEKPLNKCVGMFSTVNHLKDFKNSIDSVKLSDSIKLKLLDSFIKSP